MYTIFGYTDMMVEFRFVENSFVKAVELFRKMSPYNVTFIMRENPRTCLHVR